MGIYNLDDLKAVGPAPGLVPVLPGPILSEERWGRRRVGGLQAAGPVCLPACPRSPY